MPRTIIRSTLLATLLANLGIILTLWWQTSAPDLLSGGAQQLIALGRVAGLLAAFAILMQLLLIGRVRWVEAAWGFDRLTRFHHYNGLMLFFFLLAHPLLIISGYRGLNGVTIVQQIVEFFTQWPYVSFAMAAVIMFIGIIILSVVIVRKRLKYETWYTTHLCTYLAIALAFFHQVSVGTDLQRSGAAAYWYALYAFVIANLLYFRFIRPVLDFWRYRFYVSDVVAETDEATSIYIRGKNLQHFTIQAGQFMIVRFLQTGFWTQAHPFSLSCAPNGEYLRITVKKLGDFTKKLPALQVGTKIIIDGPHGDFTAALATQPSVLLIAGGIGITPLRSLAETFATQKKPVSLIYSNSNDHFILKHELESLRTNAHLSVSYLNSEKEGRLDAEKLQRLAPGITASDIYLCGPKPMMRSIRSLLLQKGIPRRHIHFEKFSLG